ncbi:hypothetical protein WICMUC_004228 [Wickerhamomyces mucosus]|uniref:Uncharacterized protein n=1 Tax=Wickerhamomyces mucosus TaxID=1378264 RepID=A0A9P8PHW2_9ASCO|nr:hypothetical protein WICMUC_004228 [Wickerhamomyces mucosus]
MGKQFSKFQKKQFRLAKKHPGRNHPFFCSAIELIFRVLIYPHYFLYLLIKLTVVKIPVKFIYAARLYLYNGIYESKINYYKEKSELQSRVINNNYLSQKQFSFIKLSKIFHCKNGSLIKSKTHLVQQLLQKYGSIRERMVGLISQFLEQTHKIPETLISLIVWAVFKVRRSWDDTEDIVCKTKGLIFTMIEMKSLFWKVTQVNDDFDQEQVEFDFHYLQTGDQPTIKSNPIDHPDEFEIITTVIDNKHVLPESPVLSGKTHKTELE